MLSPKFYHSTIRRTIAAFGSLFNNISIDRSGKNFRVPLAYGPKQKFLARVENQRNLEDAKVAIKLPRLSFEITSITYDAQAKLNRMNKVFENTSTGRKVTYSYAPYIVTIQLAAIAKNQDDALQIVEQIIPWFQPDYTITVNEGMDISSKTDIPITLNNVDLSDDYEGDFMSRRAIVYTMDFSLKIRFYGPTSDTGVIKKTIVDTRNIKGDYFSRYIAQVDPIEASEDDTFTILESNDYLPSITTGFAVVNPTPTIGDILTGIDSAAVGEVTSTDADGNVTLSNIDGFFEIGETVSNQAGSTFTIKGLAPNVE